MINSRAPNRLARPDRPGAARSVKFSIVIPVYNDWPPLNECLRSLAQQINAPSFEIIIVDDGSTEAVPEVISKWDEHCDLTLIRQHHAGVSSARNRGIQASNAPIVLFVDADCRVDANCLRALERTVDESPQQHYFQLHLVGDRSNGAVGRAEELRFIVLQRQLICPIHSIRYLNTAGFAIRRTQAGSDSVLFSPLAIRGEDTLLLANLIRKGELPLFVSDAIVQHSTSLSLAGYLRKIIPSAYMEGATLELVSSNDIKIQLSHRERLKMLRLAWQCSADKKIGRAAWFVLLIRQSLRLAAIFWYRHFRLKSS